MPFCARCGAALQPADRFCTRCGLPPAGSGPGAGRPPAAGMPEHIAAALCYLLGLITGVLFLVVEPYRSNRLIRFHAFQSVFLSAAWFVVWLAAVILLPGLGFSWSRCWRWAFWPCGCT